VTSSNLPTLPSPNAAGSAEYSPRETVCTAPQDDQPRQDFEDLCLEEPVDPSPAASCEGRPAEEPEEDRDESDADAAEVHAQVPTAIAVSSLVQFAAAGAHMGALAQPTTETPVASPTGAVAPNTTAPTPSPANADPALGAPVAPAPAPTAAVTTTTSRASALPAPATEGQGVAPTTGDVDVSSRPTAPRGDLPSESAAKPSVAARPAGEAAPGKSNLPAPAQVAEGVPSVPETSSETLAKNTPTALAPESGGRGANQGLPEKSAGSQPAVLARRDTTGEKNILPADSKDVATNSRPDGTGTALPADMTRAPVLPQSRWSNRAGFSAGRDTMAGVTVGGDETSISWKGWTNGGGERASTAAQFARLGESKPNLGASVFATSGATAPRTMSAAPAAQPTVATTPMFPTEQTALLAPVGAAIERLVLHGREQLALTVRFEQGGSLSLKLAMRGGEIATQIQTDVPGLEGALRSAWNQLSQEWEGRGLKLANPEFSTSSTPTGQDHAATGGERRAPDRGAAQSDLPSAMPARPVPGKTTRRVSESSESSTADSTVGVAATPRPGIQTWA
jgi:hypothetical protein